MSEQDVNPGHGYLAEIAGCMRDLCSPYHKIPDPFQVQLGTGSTLLYTVPSAATGMENRAVLLELIVCNTDSSARTYTLYVIPSGGAAGVATSIAAAVTLAANSTDKLSLHTAMKQGATVKGLASVSNVITVTGSVDLMLMRV